MAEQSGGKKMLGPGTQPGGSASAGAVPLIPPAMMAAAAPAAMSFLIDVYFLSRAFGDVPAAGLMVTSSNQFD